MMRLPPFTYHAPVSVADAVKLLAEHGPEAMLVAGGTDLYPNLKRRQFEPAVLVGLRGVRELGGVRGSAGAGVSIGAGTTLTAVSRHAEIAAAWAPVHAALDHRCLNDVEGLGNPTTEVLAPWIMQRIGGEAAIFLVAVRVYESSSTWCEVRR